MAEIDIVAARGGWLRHVEALAHHRYSPWALAAIAFADSSFLPIPPDLLLVPMVLLRPQRMHLLLLICTIASALGAAVGYVIGYGLWTAIGQPLVELYGYRAAFEQFHGLVEEWGVWIIILKAFTPIPFKIAAISAGVAGMEPVSFIVAAIVGRALHFAMVGATLVVFGGRIMAVVTRYERPMMVISLVVLVALAIGYHLR